MNEHIIHTSGIFLPIYCELFNCILDTGIYPDQWTQGMIIPIYKNKGDKKDPCNYRPIIFVSCLSKVFISIINNRLTHFLESNYKLSETQHGFRSGYSTIDNIFVLHFIINYLKTKQTKKIIVHISIIHVLLIICIVWDYGKKLWILVLMANL